MSAEDRPTRSSYGPGSTIQPCSSAPSGAVVHGTWAVSRPRTCSQSRVGRRPSGEGPTVELELDRGRRSRLEHDLGERLELLLRPERTRAGRRHVELHDLGARTRTDVGHRHLDPDRLTRAEGFLREARLADLERGVRQAVAERELHVDASGLVPAVPDEEPLAVADAPALGREVAPRRVVLHPPRAWWSAVAHPARHRRRSRRRSPRPSPARRTTSAARRGHQRPTAWPPPSPRSPRPRRPVPPPAPGRSARPGRPGRLIESRSTPSVSQSPSVPTTTMVTSRGRGRGHRSLERVGGQRGPDPELGAGHQHLTPDRRLELDAHGPVRRELQHRRDRLLGHAQQLPTLHQRLGVAVEHDLPVDEEHRRARSGRARATTARRTPR